MTAAPPAVTAALRAHALRVSSGNWSGQDETGASVALRVTADGRRVARFAPAAAPFTCPDGETGKAQGLSLVYPMKIARNGGFGDRDISGGSILIVKGKFARRSAAGSYIVATTIAGQTCTSPNVRWIATPG
jgi:hypothetical protein